MPRAPRGDKQELIRQAAVRVFARNGFFNTTTDQIAHEAGIAVGTIYNYFRSKAEILEHIFAVESDKRVRFFGSVRHTEMSTLDKIHFLLQAHFAEIAKDPQVGQILVREQQYGDQSEIDGLTRFLQGIPEHLAALLAEGIERGDVRVCDTMIAGSSLFGAIQAVVSRAVFEADEELRGAILQRAPDEIMAILIRGVFQSP